MNKKLLNRLKYGDKTVLTNDCQIQINFYSYQELYHQENKFDPS